ncbi:MAG: hypothetical protein JST01_16255 [Cyanobacteria bacterium SZAS TMP-1]|nr:hypothetical protein [Cyanobacteria bacterium SZAS TMP-1]
MYLLLILVAILCVSPACLADTGATSAQDPSAVPDVKIERTGLSPAEQAKFLQTRGPGSILGKLGNFASLLYAAENILIGSTDREVLEKPLHTAYPSRAVYQPTRAEFFDTIARQTGTSYKYMADNDSWIFDPPAMPVPYSIDVLPGWKVEDRGQYVAYIPDMAPVGMDIYMMGRYSDLQPEQKVKSENFMAMACSQALPKGVGPADMKAVDLDGVQALYYECPGRVKDMHWRQWAFIKNGQGYLIVSAFKSENKDKIVGDVDRMLKTFHVK